VRATAAGRNCRRCAYAWKFTGNLLFTVRESDDAAATTRCGLQTGSSPWRNSLTTCQLRSNAPFKHEQAPFHGPRPRSFRSTWPADERWHRRTSCPCRHFLRPNASAPPRCFAGRGALAREIEVARSLRGLLEGLPARRIYDRFSQTMFFGSFYHRGKQAPENTI